MYKTILAVSIVSLTGCSGMMKDIEKDNESQRELQFVKDFCESSSLVGSKTGFNLLVDAKRKELESANASIDASAYRKLSQELQTYTAKSEILNGRYNEACRIRALCLYRKKIDEECTGSREEYDLAKKEFNVLFSSLEQFSPAKEANK